MKLGDMTNVPIPTSAAGWRAPSTAADEQKGAGDLAWRREMERAQSETWFLGVLPTSSTPALAATAKPTMAASIKAPAASSAVPAPERMASRGPVASGAARSASTICGHERQVGGHAKPMQAAFHGDGRTVAAVGGLAASSEVVQLQQSPDMAMRLSSLTASRTALEQPVDIHLGAPNEEALRAASGDQPHAVPRAGRLPVRLHVEGDEKQSTVWLGVDAAALAQLPDLAAAVRRWLTRAGYGEPTWICNGHALSSDELTESQAEAADPRSPRSEPLVTFVLNQTPGEAA